MNNIIDAIVTLDADLTSGSKGDGVRVSGTIVYRTSLTLSKSELLARKLLFIEFLIGEVVENSDMEFEDILAGLMIAHSHGSDDE